MSRQDFADAAKRPPPSRPRGAWWHCRAFLQKYLQPNARILVHCAIGVNRSATIVVAWLMDSRGWSLDEAFRFVESRRPIVDPVDGHMDQLEAFQQARLQLVPPAVPVSGIEVTVTIPEGAPPGTKLAVPVRGGDTKIYQRVPEGMGPGSTLILSQLSGGEWDVKIGKLVPIEALPTAGASSQFVAGDSVEAEYRGTNWYPAVVAEVRRDGTYLLDWWDGDAADRVKSPDKMRRSGAPATRRPSAAAPGSAPPVSAAAPLRRDPGGSLALPMRRDSGAADLGGVRQ